MEVLTPSRYRTTLRVASQHAEPFARSKSARRVVPDVWVISASLAMLGLAALPFDAALAGFMHRHQAWDGWKIVLLSEIFAHAWGVGLIALGIAGLSQRLAPKIPRLFCASLGAGLLANLGKLVCARTRPHSFNLELSGWESFQGWFPWWNEAYADVSSSSVLQSFPSAHAATAAGLAWGLSRLFPQGKSYFVLLAVLAMLQRMVVGAHFPSDVCWGSAVGLLWANVVFGDSWLARRFVELEKHLANRWNTSRKST